MNSLKCRGKSLARLRWHECNLFKRKLVLEITHEGPTNPSMPEFFKSVITCISISCKLFGVFGKWHWKLIHKTRRIILVNNKIGID